MALAFASPSSAADLPRKAAPYYVAPFNWTGFYIGVNGGYGWGTSDWSSAVTAGSAKPKGGLLGGTLGYNLQTGVWVWGLEADLDYSWMKGSDSSGTGVCAGVGCETKNTYLATGRGRIGYAFDRWLPYITGGAAYGGIKMTPNTGLTETKSRLGWTAGGGVEYAITNNWSARVEYRYTDYGHLTDSTPFVFGFLSSATHHETENAVRAGFSYKFDGIGAAPIAARY